MVPRGTACVIPKGKLLRLTPFLFLLVTDLCLSIAGLCVIGLLPEPDTAKVLDKLSKI